MWISNTEDKNFDWSFLNIQYTCKVSLQYESSDTKFWALNETFTAVITQVGFLTRKNFLMLPKLRIESEASSTNDTFVGSCSLSITLLCRKSEFRRTLLLCSSHPWVLAPAEFFLWSMVTCQEHKRVPQGGSWRNPTRSSVTCFPKAGSWVPFLETIPRANRRPTSDISPFTK